jgi:hypothetical protein
LERKNRDQRSLLGWQADRPSIDEEANGTEQAHLHRADDIPTRHKNTPPSSRAPGGASSGDPIQGRFLLRIDLTGS